VIDTKLKQMTGTSTKTNTVLGRRMSAFLGASSSERQITKNFIFGSLGD